MNQYYIIFLFLAISIHGISQRNMPEGYVTKFEKTPTQTVTYEEGMSYWKNLADDFPELNLQVIGQSDIGKPLHAVILSKEGLKTVADVKENGLPIVLINNAIHPGEPCGVDATMMFFRDILLNDSLKQKLDSVSLVAIPFYNIGGALNRNSTTRANQNGPEEYGFRGNAQNLDLNRDFIKADSKNAQAMNRLFAALKPDIFIDNHTTNGADYQYVMTLISSMPVHYNEPLRDLFTEYLKPYLFQQMENSFPMTPYVHSLGETPFSEGIVHFKDLPRYSMGYASLHDALSFTAETHMLKSYKQRVQSTYNLLTHLLLWTNKWGGDILAAKKQAAEEIQANKEYVLEWQIDTTKHSLLTFDGYKAKHKASEISGISRLYYDTNEPETREIPFYNSFVPVKTITKPTAYIIPQAYTKVINRLNWNNVTYQTLKTDTVINVTAYRITDYETVSEPYEGHYLHTNVEVNTEELQKQFYSSDVIVPVEQPMVKYILETLEPGGEDSFFAWNFFDGILQQKEYFSPYLFEDEAAELLQQHPEWKEELEEKKKSDPAFSKNGRAQLYFIYKKSGHYEKTHNLYPIYRVE